MDVTVVPTTAYAELQVTSNFSFLRGASHAQELVTRAKVLGQRAIAITDRNSLAGVVRAHVAAKEVGIKLLVGVRLDLQDAPSLLCFPRDRRAYGRLCRLLTMGMLRGNKGDCFLWLDDVFGPENANGQTQVFVVIPPDEATPGELAGAFAESLDDVRDRASSDTPVFLAGQQVYRGDDEQRLATLANLAAAHDVPLVATNDVHAHEPGRKPLQDVLWCIREHCTVVQAGFRLDANAERHLKSPQEMARLFADHPDAIARTMEIADLVTFSLDELRYEYPEDVVPPGETPQSELERLTWIGAKDRYPDGVPDKVRGLVEHELELIGELRYAPYFLTVYDIVRFARERDILCQGRGSAANSAVCYCLAITAVDPDRIELLFERFVSAERDEPPDIDVDFEHERREEVIQYIYDKYGRDRAGMTATVISYRTRSAVREVSKALGLSQDVAGALVGMVWGFSRDELPEEHTREADLDPTGARLRQVLDLYRELRGFPRHLSQHVGGFVLTRGPLSEVVPIGNAAMEDRTVVEWDKDDLDALGILKVDVLGLGMLTCIRKGFDLLREHYGQSFDLAEVPAEDSGVYDMLCKGDSLGVFQVESRAQMTMLPRLKPRTFYDLVIEVAIVRPGPIQGDMVHPYLRRRAGEEEVVYPSKELEEVLGKTLGVPLFQEQAMRIAIVGAGFAPSEADGLRRAMATFKHSGKIHTFRDKFINGMTARGYELEFAERCFKQIEGFGEYGFPESHAASFSLLVYVSAWLKCYYPAVFACALLNSQPMGFYAPAQIVRDAQDHGVKVWSADINHSDWDCTLEPLDDQGVMALRLGLRQIKGMREDAAQALMRERENGYHDPHDLWRRTGLRAGQLEVLAQADAFASVGLARREALWAVRALTAAPLPLFVAAEKIAVAGTEISEFNEPVVALPQAGLGEEVIADYLSLRLSLKQHPLALLRPHLGETDPAAQLNETATKSMVNLVGLVTCRQRPSTASGVIFITLEDETGVANLIVWPKVFERYRKVVLSARLLGVRGEVQREGIVVHVIARRLVDLTPRLAAIAAQPDDAPAPQAGVSSGDFGSRDFH